MKAGQFKRTAYCNDRGHVQGLAVIQCIDQEHFQIVGDGISHDEFYERFHMFMMLDDIECTQSGSHILSLQGPSSEEILTNIGISVPEEGMFSTWSTVTVYKRDRSGMGGWDLVGKDLEEAKEALVQAGATLGEEADLDELRTLAGLPKWPQDATEKTFLHELGLNTDCCAFDKGCYVGQEIINRMDIKQIFNRKLLRLNLSSSVPINSRLFVPDQLRKPVGVLTSTATKEGVHYGLGLIRKKCWEAGTVLSVYPPGDSTESVIASATVLKEK